MKLISTLNSIIVILIPNKDVQEHLEVVHKALTIGTTFWTNLKQFSFFFFFHLTICVQTLCMICDSFALSYECWKTHFNVDIWMWCVNIFLRCIITFSSMEPFETICKTCDFLNLRLLPNFSNYYYSTLQQNLIFVFSLWLNFSKKYTLDKVKLELETTKQAKDNNVVM